MGCFFSINALCFFHNKRSPLCEFDIQITDTNMLYERFNISSSRTNRSSPTHRVDGVYLAEKGRPFTWLRRFKKRHYKYPFECSDS